MKLAELQIRQANLTIQPGGVRGPQRPVPGEQSPEVKKPTEPFADILSKKIADNTSVKFSAHAAKRMLERNILPNEDQLARLTTGFERAREKGADSSLILVDDNAYVVSIKNETVITALNKEMAQGNVFSNIDSVAIV